MFFEEDVDEIQPDDVLQDSRELVVKWIDRFFSNKMFYCGGAIPKRFLHDPNKITMVLNFNIIKGVDRAYEVLEPLFLSQKEIEHSRKTGGVTKDIKMVTDIFRLFEQEKVPQQFFGGLLIMYLEYVEGIDFA